MALLCILLLTCVGTAPAAGPAEFVVSDGSRDSQLPKIVVQHDADHGTGVDWKAAVALYKLDGSEAGRLRNAALYLQEGIRKLSGQTPEIVSGSDLTQGIVLATLAGAPELADDPEVIAALRNDGKDAYNDREAFLIRSEPKRLLIVANTAEGLIAAVPELLESVGYEVLGMGPNWTFVPGEDGPDRVTTPRKLSFQINRPGRAGYYFRSLSATSGQPYGVGTCFNTPLSDPADEAVDASYRRWQIGAHMHSTSMPGFPGHALQAYHKAVVEHIRKTGVAEGFLAKTLLGKEADRAAATAELNGALWINSDGPPKAFLCDGTTWREANLLELGVNLDLSIPYVREIILENMKVAAEAHFKTAPSDVFIFGTDPEDGAGYTVLETLLKHKNWYPEYLASRKIPFGQPYVLHGYLGLDQPKELWDPAAPSDVVFGFNNWLLREFDYWLESLPKDQHRTGTGLLKKDLVRCSLYSYNFHDVPPNFNLDPRIRVMIASYPKHRGRGKWKAFASQQDMARSFQVQLPREPSGDYRILSIAYFSDAGVDFIPAGWSASARSLQKDLGGTYHAGIKALSCETDFNFGKFGLGYYLYAKMMWNPNLTGEQLEALRSRWLQRSFGSAHQEMKAYYDFMLSDNFPVNGPNAWAHAIGLIAVADRRLDPAVEPAAKRRLDDLKQFWYYYYLIDTGHMKRDDPLAKEFLWKGQMSYMVAQHVVSRRTFGVEGEAATALGADLTGGPAHFTAAETAVWWDKVQKHWPATKVDRFAYAVLADGRKGSEVDLNDLISVKEFETTQAPQPFVYNSGYMKPPTILNVASRAGQTLGFQLSWPRDETGKDGYYIARDVPYGVDVWNSAAKAWDPVVDPTMTVQASRETDNVFDGSKRHLAEIRFAAPKPGTYRFTFGAGGNLGYLTGLDFDLATGKLKAGAARSGFTASTNTEGLTQEGVYIYIPKGVKSLDLEVWDSYGVKRVTLYKSWRGQASPTVSRQVEIGERKTHRISLIAGEDGSLAKIDGNGFAFPFLYSVPPYWSKSPRDLLVPRAIAKADGLTEAK